jgi:multidrug resistance efflux pump
MGAVTSVRAREGDRVRAGQTLIEIDNRQAAAQLQKASAGLRQAQEAQAEVEQSTGAAQSAKAAAEANRRLAEATYERYKILLERKSISPQEFDEAKAKYQVAEAEVERAGRMLEILAAKKRQTMAQIDQAKADIAGAQVFTGYGRISTPIGGVVTSKQTEVGSTATPGAPLMTIEDDSRYRLEAAVEESQVGRIRLRDPARVRIDAIGAEDINGAVAEIVPAADPASRSYTVKIDIRSAKAQSLLRTGMYGTARFVAGQKQSILIPEKAIVARGQLTGVFVVDGSDIARFRLIKTGKTFGDRVEILSGLGDGDRMVVAGLSNVSDGSRIE